jgi:hypothetical protein
LRGKNRLHPEENVDFSGILTLSLAKPTFLAAFSLALSKCLGYSPQRPGFSVQTRGESAADLEHFAVTKKFRRIRILDGS